MQQQEPDRPLELMFSEIERGHAAGLHYMALATALIVPDICGALEAGDGQASGARYKDWFNANLAAQYPRLTDVDCYSLRCGVLHQGRMGHPKSQFERIVFTLPNANGHVFHNNLMNDVLNLDAATFCRDFVGAGRNWYNANAANPTVLANIGRLLRHRPNGLAPYIVGTPVIA